MEVMTVVEGKVATGAIREFESAYSSAKDAPKPPGWKMSMLLHDTEHEGLYRVATLWESRQALEEMQKNTKVPFARALFNKFGVDSSLRVFEVPIAIKR